MNRTRYRLAAMLLAASLMTTAACGSERTPAPQPAATTNDWVDLFDGETLDGWQAEGGAVWTVEDGILIGKQGPDFAAGDLFTVDEYADFELEVEYRVVWPANSGIWFRYKDDQHAYQADILEYEDPVAYSGTIYAPGKMFIAINDDPEIEDREGWNTMVIHAVGEHLNVMLNGVQTAHAHDSDHAEGRIGIQIHVGEEFGDMEIHVRKARIRVID